jgi:hypothetical protein
MDYEAREVAAVPADLSKDSLIGWVSAIRVTALGLPPKSPERDTFLALAVGNLHYAAWLLRGNKARADYLKGEATKLPTLASTVAD